MNTKVIFCFGAWLRQADCLPDDRYRRNVIRGTSSKWKQSERMRWLEGNDAIIANILQETMHEHYLVCRYSHYSFLLLLLFQMTRIYGTITNHITQTESSEWPI